MTSYHSPHHWIPVAIALGFTLLTLSNVYGQHTDSNAVFEGRPAMSGANPGLGPMAGPPQGGIGVQGQDNSQLTLRRRATGVADMPQGKLEPNTDVVAENHAVRDRKDIVTPDRDKGVAKDQRGIVQRAKDAIRRITQRKKHGVSNIQTAKQ